MINYYLSWLPPPPRTVLYCTVLYCTVLYHLRHTLYCTARIWPTTHVTFLPQDDPYWRFFNYGQWNLPPQSTSWVSCWSDHCPPSPSSLSVSPLSLTDGYAAFRTSWADGGGRPGSPQSGQWQCQAGPATFYWQIRSAVRVMYRYYYYYYHYYYWLLLLLL